MKTARSRRTLRIAALLACGVAAAGGAWVRRTARETRAWREAAPPVVALDEWPREFATAVRAAQTRVAERREPAALDELSELLLANGFAAEAEQALRALARFAPDDPRPPHRLGTLLAGAGRLDEALPFLRRASALAPRSVATGLKLGEALAKTNRPAEAAAAFEAVLGVEPDNAYARVGLARLEIDDGRWAAARRRLEETVRLAPNFSAAPALLAVVHERGGRAAEAAEARAQAGRLPRYVDPPDPWNDALWRRCFDAYRLRVTAATYVHGRRFDEALAVLERARALAPGDALVRRQLAQLQAQRRDFAAARENFEAAVAAAPRDGAAWLELVGVCRALNDGAGAAATLARGLAACPAEAGLHFERGRDAAAAGDWRLAETAFAEAMRLGPEVTSAYVERAGALFRLGRAEEAVDVLIAAMERHPNREQADGFLRRAREAGCGAATLRRLSEAHARVFPDR